MGRSSLFVNARVHLPGSKGRATVATSTVGYIATRPGADMSATPSDLRRAELAERMALAGYYAERPGSTALFDQDGQVPLREARTRLAAAEGAIATWVVSVRREEADELALGCKEEWQRWCRRELNPALAAAMGVPESSVRWVAAEHENAENSKHVHVISWSSDGSFSSVMPRQRLERARAMLTDAALAPAVEAALRERDIARSLAVDAVRRIPAEEARVSLPPTGRISYAHLRRWHPETAGEVREELARAAERHPAIRDAEERYRVAVERYADLKGLGGGERDRYVGDAMRDLTARRANALLRTIAPDRTEAPESSRTLVPAPLDGPATRRQRERRMRCEVAACVPHREMAEAAAAVHEHRPVPTGTLRACPTYLTAVRRAPAAATRAALSVIEDATVSSGRRDFGDEAGDEALRILTGAALAALRAATGAGGAAARLKNTMEKGMRV
ncbi:hypothetical protein [Enorma massiliensis]|uniref:hypothetical protein n=1 Tax=Enorma massiliensis TaxID=1472761 RepID=UPI003AF0A345